MDVTYTTSIFVIFIEGHTIIFPYKVISFQCLGGPPSNDVMIGVLTSPKLFVKVPVGSSSWAGREPNVWRPSLLPQAILEQKHACGNKGRKPDCTQVLVKFLQSVQWRIQDFSEGVGQLPKVLLFFNFFAENCMKMKEFGPPGRRP